MPGIVLLPSERLGQKDGAFVTPICHGHEGCRGGRSQTTLVPFLRWISGSQLSNGVRATVVQMLGPRLLAGLSLRGCVLLRAQAALTPVDKGPVADLLVVVHMTCPMLTGCDVVIGLVVDHDVPVIRASLPSTRPSTGPRTWPRAKTIWFSALN